MIFLDQLPSFLYLDEPISSSQKLPNCEMKQSVLNLRATSSFFRDRLKLFVEKTFFLRYDLTLLCHLSSILCFDLWFSLLFFKVFLFSIQYSKENPAPCSIWGVVQILKPSLSQIFLLGLPIEHRTNSLWSSIVESTINNTDLSLQNSQRNAT